jgi:hypothetical protein
MMQEPEPRPERLTVEDAMTQALLKGHAMSAFERDPTLGWLVADCRACGLRMFQYADGAIAGPVFFLECSVGRRMQP